MRGRKPKPSRLKLLTGNPGKRPLNKREAKPEPDLPTCPSHLNKDARKEWTQMSRLLYRHGLLTMIDRPALAAYCQAWGKWVEAERHLRVEGMVIRGRDKNPVRNPWTIIANQAWEQVRKMLLEFGMTPSSRSHVVAAGPGDYDGGDDETIQYLSSYRGGSPR